MNKKNPIIAVFLAFALAIIFCATAAAVSIPSPSKDFYVYDGADVISKSTEDYIVEKNKKLAEKTGAQIVFATVASTEEMEISEYASALFTKWNIGDSEKMNGLLVLLAIDDEDYWVTQGTGIKDRLTTGNVKTILDSYLEPHFASGDYDNGAQTLFDKLLASFESIYSIDLDAAETGDDTVKAKTDGDVSSVIVTVVIVVAVIVLFVVAVIAVVRKFDLLDRRRYTVRKAPVRTAVRTTRPRPAQRVNTSNGARSNYNGQRGTARQGAPNRRGNTANRPRPAGTSQPRPRVPSGGRPSNGRNGQR